MTKNPSKLFFTQLISLFFVSSLALAEVVKKIEVIGNNRISSETIKSFSPIKINDDINENNINTSLKSLYESNFFKNVNIKFIQNVLIIEVDENPIIQNINYEGIKSSKLLEDLRNNVVLKSRSSFNEVLLNQN